MTTIWADLHRQLAAVVAELRSSGAVPSWVEADAMSALVMAVAAGTAVSTTVEATAVSHRDIATQFASLLLAASRSR